MDDNGGPKNGGTDPIISNTSTGSNPFKTTTQPDVPAWMFARNNSVHAPVFGQPSDRQSASHKRHSMPSSFSEAADSQSPFAKIRASIAANNAKSQAKASQSSLQPLSHAPGAQDTLNDDQALALLLKNETVARLFQNAFNTRVEEHQQKVERAYNQRLLELEEYTRSWRDTAKELWLAVGEGDFNPNKDHQETLSWEGPQLAGRDFNPERPIAPQEVIEKEFDKDGTVACINVKNPSISVKNPGTSVKNPKNPSTSHSDPHFNLQNWTKSKGCGSKNFETFADHLAAPLKKGSGRLVFRHETKFGTIKYRTMTWIDNIIKVHRTDVVIELTPSNVALFGKAFCYLKNTHDRLFNQANAHCGKSVSPDEVSFLVDRFSSEPTKRFIDVLPLYNGNLKVIPDLFAVNINVSTILKRLLIARPCYAINGSISGAKFFDVGRGAYTTWRESDEDIILFEDKVSFLQLAMLLCFSINTGLVPVSLGASTPVLSGTSSDAGFKLTGLRSDQVSHQPSAGIVPNPTQGGRRRRGSQTSKAQRTIPRP